MSIIGSDPHGERPSPLSGGAPTLQPSAGNSGGTQPDRERLHEVFCALLVWSEWYLICIIISIFVKQSVFRTAQSRPSRTRTGAYLG